MSSFSADDNDTNPIADGYDANAEYWIEIVRTGADRYQVELTQPALLDAIGDVTGADILDAGCGEGSFSRHLVASGASCVYGVDSCLPLIKAAKKQNFTDGDENLVFLHADVESIPLCDNSIDLVVVNRLPHALHQPALRYEEFARVLKPNGRMVLLSQHPCFYSARGKDEPQKASNVTEYFSGRLISQHFLVAGKQSPAPSVQPIYSLESYIGMIVSSGFTIIGIREPHPGPELLADRWWTDNFRYPKFLIVICTRV